MLFKTYVFITPAKIWESSMKTNELKIMAPTWDEEFELLDGSYSVSDIPDCIEYISKKH